MLTVGPGQDLVHVPLVEAVKGPVTEEPEVDLGTESGVKAEIKRKEKRRRTKSRTKNCTTSSVGKLKQILCSDD
jgi:hypothetical protein